MKAVIISIFLIIFSALGFIALNNKQAIPSPEAIPLATPVATDAIASFEIYTNGTKRVFTSSMYHNQSADAFITNPDPSIVHIKKEGVTWDDFFKTLPFSLTKDCLITGTKQKFCNTNTNKLTFTLNGNNTPDALDMEIKPNAKLIINYGK